MSGLMLIAVKKHFNISINNSMHREIIDSTNCNNLIKAVVLPNNSARIT